jgi:hypothetical protein
MSDYNPLLDPCRVCGDHKPPRVQRGSDDRVEVVCRFCGSLLENSTIERLIELLAEANRS